MPFELRLAEIEPGLGRPVRFDQVRVVGNAVLGPVPRHPTILFIDEAVILLQDFLGCRRGVLGDQILLQDHRHVRHAQGENVGQMPAGGFFRDEAFRRILRTQVAHVELDEGIAFLEKPGVISSVFAAPGVHEIELAFLARALFEAFFPLILRQFCQGRVELVRGRLGGKTSAG